MTVVKNYTGPKPSPAWKKLMGKNKLAPIQATVSGEIAVTKRGIPIGVLAEACKIDNVNLTVLGCGKDDSSQPALAVDVFIDGTSCLTTKPSVTAISGEASTHKSTVASGEDTGVNAAVINTSANEAAAGSILTMDLVYSGSASPTTKMYDVAVIVEVGPRAVT